MSIIIGWNDRHTLEVPYPTRNHGILCMGGPGSGKNNLVLNFMAQWPKGVGKLVLISKFTPAFYHLGWEITPNPKKLFSTVPGLANTVAWNPIAELKRLFGGWSPSWALALTEIAGIPAGQDYGLSHFFLTSAEAAEAAHELAALKDYDFGNLREIAHVLKAITKGQKRKDARQIANAIYLLSKVPYLNAPYGSHESLNLAHLIANGGTLFVVVPPGLNRFLASCIHRLFYVTALAILEHFTLTGNKGVELLMVIDEGPDVIGSSTIAIPAQGRGYGMGHLIGLQHGAQTGGQRDRRDIGAILWQCCEHKIITRLDDLKQREEIIKLAGKYEKEDVSYGQNRRKSLFSFLWDSIGRSETTRTVKDDCIEHADFNRVGADFSRALLFSTSAAHGPHGEPIEPFEWPAPLPKAAWDELDKLPLPITDDKPEPVKQKRLKKIETDEDEEAKERRDRGQKAAQPQGGGEPEEPQGGGEPEEPPAIIDNKLPDKGDVKPKPEKKTGQKREGKAKASPKNK